jgi:hypothetical protein
VARQGVPDRVDARYRIPEHTVQDIVGRVLHRVAADNLVPSSEMPRLKESLGGFVRDHAREIVNGGDGVRVPLSALHEGAPDVFVRGVMRRSDARYLGSTQGQTLGGKVGASHEHSVELTKSDQFSSGIFSTGYETGPWGSVWPEGKVTYEGGKDRSGTVSQQLGHEQPFVGDGKVHQFSYPTQFEVHIGGRWAKLTDPAQWSEPRMVGGSDDPGATTTVTGHVEVAAPERRGVELGAESTLSSGEPQWHDGDVPATPDQREGYLPVGFELDSLKPVPTLISTISAMLGTPRSSRWVDWMKRPFVGRRPADVNKPNRVGLDVLEEFASPAARMARFGRTALHRDTVRLASHNSGGLVGSRDLSAQLDHATLLANPRVVAREDEHRFTRIEHARSQSGTG